MNLHFNLFNIIVLLGMVQGLVLSLMLIFSRSGNRHGKFFLAVFMLILVYNSFGTFCWSSGFSTPGLLMFDDIFPYTFIFATGPSMYLYILCNIHSQKLSAKSTLYIYLPFFIDFVLRIGFLMYAISWNKGWIEAVRPDTLNEAYLAIDRPSMVFVFWIYLIRSVSKFKRSSNTGVDVQMVLSAGEHDLIRRWLKRFLVMMVAVAIVWTMTIFGSIVFDIQGITYYYLIEVFLVILIYWIGFTGYHRTKIIYVQAERKVASSLKEITPTEIGRYVKSIRDAMAREKLYLDPELTVARLAAHLKLSPKIISAVLNQHIKQGFSEFVNFYRVEEVKEKMKQLENRQMTIATIAYDCGFNSLATFQRAFKGHLKMTPREFLSKELMNEEK
ncbi:MAG TPA: AraC family transcriptional regulator [Arachidicoccus sp.]|nr:AraC family transcriptional regulator [Arachidicoccus sp.]